MREMAKGNIDMTVKEALLDLNRPGKDMVVPIIQETSALKENKDGKEVKMDSFALFKNEKLAFMTNKKESKAVLWLQEKMQKKLFTFPVSKNKEVSVQIVDNRIKPKFLLKNGKPEFILNVNASGNLFENEANLRIEDPETYHMMVGKMEKEIQKDISKLIRHAHSEGVDVYGFGWHIYRFHYQLWADKWKNNWDETLKDLTVTVKVDADIQRTSTSGKNEED